MSAYSNFRTNPETEVKGIVLDYGMFYFRVARAGGANKLYNRVMKRVFDPHRRAIQTDTLPEKKLAELMRQAYAEGVVTGWGYKKHEDDKSFIDGKFLAEETDAETGDVKTVELAFTPANVAKVFADLPDLFADIQEQSSKVSLYRDAVKDEDAKN